MNLEEIKTKVASEEYDFLRNNPHLGNNIILLGLGGSYAYGLNTLNSDLDVRGCALNSKEEILTYKDFEQVIDNATDTTIYSFNKLIRLLAGCNPNLVELGGLRPEHYLYVSPIGQEMLDNFDMFLSQKASHTFGGYATQQIHKMGVKVEQTGRNKEAMRAGKIAKHMCHLVRLHLMAIDILERGEIITYRPEHDLLMGIRNGDYLNSEGKPIPEFFELVDFYDKKFEYAKKNTNLPKEPDMKRINEFVVSVNERVVKGEV